MRREVEYKSVRFTDGEFVEQQQMGWFCEWATIYAQESNLITIPAAIIEKYDGKVVAVSINDMKFMVPGEEF